MRMAELHHDADVAARLAPGGNNPPSALDVWKDAARDLSEWMAEHPAIENEDDAREAKKLLDRAKATAADIEAERDKLVRPLNEKVAEINARYKHVHDSSGKKPGLFDKFVNELKWKLAAFLKAEEERKLRDAEEKRRAALEAERIAREAEAREREAIENARAGELGVDVTQVVIDADDAFKDFKLRNRQAALAERDAKVRIGGGWNKPIGLRTVETLILNDAATALAAVGVTDGIRDEILKAARAYRKQHGVLPSGVTATTQRQI